MIDIAEARRRLLAQHASELELIDNYERLACALETVGASPHGAPGASPHGAPEVAVAAGERADCVIQKRKGGKEKGGVFVLPDAVMDVVGKFKGAQVFSGSALKLELVRLYPEREQSIGWGLAGALRRLEKLGRVEFVQRDGRDCVWRLAKGGAQINEDGRRLLAEIHSEIKPKGEE